MKNRKNKNKIYLYLLVILGITIGFALLSTTLKINGTAGIKENTWNIHWDDTSINVIGNTVGASNPVVSTATTSKDTVSFNVELELPGDYFEFEIDAVNEGTIDAALDLKENWITYSINNENTSLPSYMDFKVTYDDNTIPKSGDILTKREDVNTPGRQTYKIRIEFKQSETTLPSNPPIVNITVELPYVQFKDTLPEPRTCQQFQEDSWDTIAHNVTLKPDTYPIGCEKEVDMGTFGTHTVRVANNTTPNECNSTNFSQTACGFVLEFKDVITTHIMNPCDNYQYYASGNHDGWEASEMRAYLNGGVYTWYTGAKDDYSTSGIINSFPQDLKNVMINTYTISGHGSSQSNNFYTNDKLYLLSSIEVWGSDSLGSDTVIDETRQLDYYHKEGVTSENYEKAIKKYGNNNWDWWLRSARWEAIFYKVAPDGSAFGENSIMGNGVSPAFRIGKDWVLTNKTTPIKDQKWEYYYNNGLKLQDGWYKLKNFSGNDQYYFFENGFMKLGWHTENNNTYYLSEMDSDNNNYVDGNRVTGTLEIDGISYTFDENGICTNCN